MLSVAFSCFALHFAGTFARCQLFKSSSGLAASSFLGHFVLAGNSICVLLASKVEGILLQAVMCHSKWCFEPKMVLHSHI
jgi:hypothetical protein